MFGDEEAVCGVSNPTFTPAEIFPPSAPLPKQIPVAIKVARTVNSFEVF